LEKTLQMGVLATVEGGTGDAAVERRGCEDVHEQTGLSAGAVTDNNELSSNLGHYDVYVGVVGVSGIGRLKEGQRVSR
jgi:hypothetical protein